MSIEKKQLIKKAVQKFGDIYPCGRFEHLRDCFTHYENELIFWFNTIDGSTHTVR